MLSAKNGDRLREQAEQLLAGIRNRRWADTDLPEIAHTLQTGREAMEERLAMTVTSVKELGEKLAGFTEGRDDIEDMHRGQVRRNRDVLAIFAADEDMAKIADIWMAAGKYAKLLGLWVKGLNFDWDRLYGDEKPRRISLPTYPFVR